MILAVVACIAQVGWNNPMTCTPIYDTHNDYADMQSCAMRLELKDENDKTLQEIMEKPGVTYVPVCIDWKGKKEDLGNFLVRTYGVFPREKA